MPVSRPVGRALIVANPVSDAEAAAVVQRLGYQCTAADDPYAGMTELCHRPLAYRVLVLSMAGLYREELSLVQSVKRRFPHVEVWLTHTDGHQAALAEALRLGADGLLAEDGLHRTALPGSTGAETERSTPAAPMGLTGARSALPAAPVAPRPNDRAPADAGADKAAANDDHDLSINEPILTAEELRALLQEEPSLPSEQ